MQRSFAPVSFLILLVMLFHLSCAEQKNIRVIDRLSYSEASIETDEYMKKVAILNAVTTGNRFFDQAENILYETLVDNAQSENDADMLVTSRDRAFPGFLTGLDLMDNPGQRHSILSKAREQGYFAIVQAKILNISPEQKATGFLFFRKMRSFITVTMALDVYHAITYTKLSDIVRSETVKIDTVTYEDFVRGNSVTIPDVDEIVRDMAEDLAGEAMAAVADARWATVVIGVRDGRAVLAAGGAAGMLASDQLTVFEGQRLEEGPAGEMYVIPGYKIMDITVNGFDGGRAYANAGGNPAVKPGDIVVVTE